MKLFSNALCQLLKVSRVSAKPCTGSLQGLSKKMSTNLSDEALFQKIGDKGIITLNRPKALNSLSVNMIKLIYSQMKEWSSQVSCIIMCSDLEKAFCAGGDVRAITDAGKRGDVTAEGFFFNEYQLDDLINTINVPYIALINGITMGGGVGVSVHGKYRVATEKTVFAMPETSIGLFPDVGGSYFLSRMDKLGIFLGLTGHRLKGVDVFTAGIANHFCDSAKLGDLKKELLSLSDVSNIPNVLETYTKASLEGKRRNLELEPHMNEINKVFSGKTVEEIFSSLDASGSEFAIKQKDLLSRLSPSSLKVTLKMLHYGAGLTLRECLKMEYRIILTMMRNHDFFEGVRAVLIDRDNSPKWKPSRLEDVSDALVDSYFAKLPPNEELHF